MIFFLKSSSNFNDAIIKYLDLKKKSINDKNGIHINSESPIYPIGFNSNALEKSPLIN